MRNVNYKETSIEKILEKNEKKLIEAVRIIIDGGLHTQNKDEDLIGIYVDTKSRKVWAALKSHGYEEQNNNIILLHEFSAERVREDCMHDILLDADTYENRDLIESGEIDVEDFYQELQLLIPEHIESYIEDELSNI